MALTISLVRGPRVVGDLLWAAADITFDSSYPTGGEPLTVADLSFDDLEPYAQMMQLICGARSGYSFSYDFANQKLKVFTVAAHTHDLYLKNADVADSAGARVNAGANLLGANTGTSLTVTGQAAGASAHGGVLGVAAAALAEVADTTSLSTLTVRALAWAAK
jgi:hypothetical protein